MTTDFQRTPSHLRSREVDIDDTDTAKFFELPGADLSGDRIHRPRHPEAVGRLHLHQWISRSSPQSTRPRCTADLPRPGLTASALRPCSCPGAYR